MADSFGRVAAPGRHTRHAERPGLRRVSVTALVMLVLQYGLGMILNGELFKGYNGFAGEFSHIPLFLNNKLCSCGKHGCLETEASFMAMVDKAAKAAKKGAT